MKKRILSIVITLCMVLMLMPTTVFAANTDATELQNLLSLLSLLSGGTVTLSRDYTIDTTLNVTNTVTLDLNGYTISMTGSGSVINVGSGGNLTLQDSRPTATHTDASLPAGGVITGGNADRGGGVSVNGGSFTLNSGTIANCSASDGGGVYVAYGTFTMNGGAIANCSTSFDGGGVLVYSNSSMTLNGGAIQGCSASNRGGGVFNSGSFTMEGGTIANCSATTTSLSYGGGGVYNSSSFTMSGGVIENCSAASSCGGGVFSNGDFSMSGGAIIRGCSAKYGGGVFINLYKTMTMTGGTIEACTSTNDGKSDAVIIYINASLLANGGTIKGTVEKGSYGAIQNTSAGGCTVFYDAVTNYGTISGGIYYGGIQNLGSGSSVTGTYYTVTFDLNGGSGSAPTQWFFNTSTAKALQPADPTREGGIFKGWYNGDTAYDFTQPVTENITLTAKWVLTDVSDESGLRAALDAGATTIKLMADINLSSALDLSLKNITIDLNGYVISGADISINTGNGKASLTLIDSRPTATHTDSTLPVGGVVTSKISMKQSGGGYSDCVLYANGGTVTSEFNTNTNAVAIKCTSNTPTAFTGKITGYAHLYGGIYYGTIASSVTIEGKKITFQNGDNTYAYEIVDSGNNTVEPISPPIKEGYNGFDGWYNGDTKYTFGSALSEDITLTAVFSNPKAYNISYDLGGGTASNPATYTVESDAITLNAPTRSGYTFTGWSGTDLSSNTMIVTIPKGSTGDRAYTAHYTEKSDYTVVFDANGGSEVPSKTNVKWTDKVLDGITAPTKDGWEFTGWKCGDVTVTADTTYSGLAVNDTVTSVTLVAQWTEKNHYSVAFDTTGGNPIDSATNIKWTDKVLDGITAPTKNGWEFTGWKCGDVTVTADTAYSELAVNDTVTSVTLVAQWKDIAAPTGEIKVSENSWKTFLNKITFGLFFKDTQTVTITASDNSGEDVTIEYLLSDKELTTEELAAATFTAYTEAFNISPDNAYVIYAKLTDASGNVAYINSDGVVLDGIVPTISGVENGKTYCSAQTVTITEKYPASVTVNGNEVTLDEKNQFTLLPAEGTQKIVVTDKAGNVSAEMIVTVNDGHRGGTATCTSKAICDYCGEEYGELDSTNHNLEKIPAKDATVTETGNIAYWHCKDCGKYFSDQNGKNSIELKDTVTQKLPPEIIEGMGQTVTEGEKKDLTFRSNAAFSDFIRVELDGKTLDEKNYTVKEGSTIVTLKADYVATLSAGQHTIGIVSTSGTATTTFTVNAKTAVDNDMESPQTGDNSHMALWIALLFASGSLLTVTSVCGRKKEHSAK